MNTKAKIIGLAMALLLLAALPAMSQEEAMTIGGEEYGFEQFERAPVKFAHVLHEDLEIVDGACAPCHHDGKDDNGQFVEADPMACKDCHDEAGDADDATDLRTAYHKMCITCHEQAEKGPLTCGECHIK